MARELFNALVMEGLLKQDGALPAGCSGCQGRKLLLRYKQVYRVFLAKCLELSKDPDGLRPLKEYCGMPHVLLQDPDTQQTYQL